MAEKATARIDIIAELHDKASGPMGHLKGVVGGLGGLAQKAVIGVGLVGGAVTGLVAITGFQFNQLKEQARIAFTTMLGDAQKADAFIRELQSFAAKTPFEFAGLLQSTQKLLAMGFAAEEVLPTLTSIGDAVAAMGGGAEMLNRVTLALGQMKAKGKASGEEMRQLTEAGLPVWDMLAKKIGVEIPEAMDKVTKREIDATVAIAAITEGINTRYGGMMEKQSHTFGGLLSTLKDTFTIVSGTVMAPFFRLATKGMQGLANLMASPKFQEGAERVGKGIESAFGTIGRWLKDDILPILKNDVFPAIKGFITYLREDVAPVIQRIASEVAERVSPVIKAFAGYVKELLKHMDNRAALITFGILLGALAIAIIALVAPILVTIAALAAFVAFAVIVGVAVSQLIKHWEEMGVIKDIVETVFGWVQARIEAAMTVIRGIILVFTSLIKGDWSGAWEGIKQIFGGIWQAIRADVEVAAKLLAISLGLIWDGIGNKVLMVWGGIKSGVGSAINWLIDRINEFIRGINRITSLGPLGGLLGKIGISIPSIPEISHVRSYQQGGFIPAGVVQPALLHGPELVLPLNKLRAAPISIRINEIVLTRRATREDARELVDLIEEEIRSRRR